MSFDSFGALASAGQSFVSLAGGIQQARAQKARAEFEANQINFNAQLSELFADDALARGNEQMVDFAARVRQLKGTQKAAAAAQGIDVASGSAREVQEDTARIARDTTIRIRNNAWREAWGYKVSAQDQRFQAELRQLAGDFNATQTLLAGALQAGQFGLQSGQLSAKAIENAYKNRQNKGTDSPAFDARRFGERPSILGRDPFNIGPLQPSPPKRQPSALGDDPFGIGRL